MNYALVVVDVAGLSALVVLGGWDPALVALLLWAGLICDAPLELGLGLMPAALDRMDRIFQNAGVVCWGWLCAGVGCVLGLVVCWGCVLGLCAGVGCLGAGADRACEPCRGMVERGLGVGLVGVFLGLLFFGGWGLFFL